MVSEAGLARLPSHDGGYAEYMIAPSSALALVPDGLSAVDAAPLMCAGVTTYNALRNSHARPGDVVAVLGLGGLGHLGVQYAVKMGFRTVGIARGADKEPLAVSVDTDGKVFLQNTEIELESLVPKLQAIAQARGGNDERIYVRGDRTVNYGTVMKVMGRLSAAGFRRVALVTEVEQSP